MTFSTAKQLVQLNETLKPNKYIRQIDECVNSYFRS